MHVLDKSDALQLYSYLIYTFEKTSEEISSPVNFQVEDEGFIIHCFQNYNTKDSYKAISKAITGFTKSKQLHYFGLKIQQLRSLSISNKEWNTYKKYLNNEGKLALGEQKIETFIDNLTQSFEDIPNPDLTRFREYDLSQTRWWVYYYDMLKEKPGITRALLVFDDFGRLAMYNLANENTMYQTYEGTFKVYNDVHLVSRLKSKNQENRFLEMSFYIGSDARPTFSLGIYTTMMAKIASGYIIMKRIEDAKAKVEDLKSQVQFYPLKSAGSNLGVPIFNFLCTKNRNRLELPDQVITEEGLGDL
jgi:hypothetical protein